jgi:excisionase family DNA binding protein
MDTLNLEQAAQFLRLHPDTLRARAAAGDVPGAKPGKEWVFLREDLATYLRSLYKGKWQAPHGSEEESISWPNMRVSPREVRKGSCKSSITMPRDTEYERVLEPRTGSRHDGSVTDTKPTRGGKSSSVNVRPFSGKTP